MAITMGYGDTEEFLKSLDDDMHEDETLMKEMGLYDSSSDEEEEGEAGGESMSVDGGGDKQALNDGLDDPLVPATKTIIYHTTSYLDQETKAHITSQSGVLTALGETKFNFGEDGRTILFNQVEKSKCKAVIRQLRLAYKAVEGTTRLAHEVDLEAEGDQDVEVPSLEEEGEAGYMDYNEDQSLYYGPDDPSNKGADGVEPERPNLLPMYEMDHEPVVAEKVADFVVKPEVEDIDDLFGTNQPGNVDYVRDIAIATKTKANLDHATRTVHIVGTKSKHVQEAVKRLHTLTERYMAARWKMVSISLIHKGEAGAARCQMRPLSLFPYAKNQLLPPAWAQCPITSVDLSVVVAMKYNQMKGKWFCELPKAELAEMPHEIVMRYLEKKRAFDAEVKDPTKDVEALVKPPSSKGHSTTSALQHGDIYYARRDPTAAVPKWAEDPRLPKAIRNNLQAVRLGPRKFENLNVKQTSDYKPTPGQKRFIPGLSAPESRDDQEEGGSGSRPKVISAVQRRYIDSQSDWDRATPAPYSVREDPWAGYGPSSHPPIFDLDMNHDPARDISMIMSPQAQDTNYPSLGSRSADLSRRGSQSSMYGGSQSSRDGEQQSSMNGVPSWARVTRPRIEEGGNDFPALPTRSNRPALGKYDRAPVQRSLGNGSGHEGQNSYLNILTSNLGRSLDFLRGYQGHINFKIDFGKILYRGETSRDKIFPWDYLYNFVNKCEAGMSTRMTCSSDDLEIINKAIEAKPFVATYIFQGMWRNGPGGVPWKPYTIEFDPNSWRVIRVVDQYERALEINVNNTNQRWDWQWSIEHAKIERHDIKPFNIFISKLQRAKNGFDVGFDAVPDFLTVSSVHLRQTSMRTLNRPEYQLENVLVEVNKWQKLDIQKATSQNNRHPYRAILPSETLQLCQDSSWYGISMMAPHWTKELAQNAKLGVGQQASWTPTSILTIDEKGVPTTITKLIKAAELIARQISGIGEQNGEMISRACADEIGRIDAAMLVDQPVVEAA